jgi:hypothetical protein
MQLCILRRQFNMGFSNRSLQIDLSLKVKAMISKRAESISPFIVMDVLERAQEMEALGIDNIHLEVGEPDFDIPPAVKAATRAVLDEDSPPLLAQSG